MENPLNLLARAHLDHTDKIIGLCLLLTVVLSLGLPQIQLQTNFQESLPDSLPPIAAQDKVEANFGSSNSIIVLFQTSDDKLEENYVTDVRDPRMIRTLNFLEDELNNEPSISSVNSMASLFSETPDSKAQIKQTLQQSQASFTNRDYTATTMFIQLSNDMTEENVREATKTIEENIEQSPRYPGIEIQTTGTPVMRNVLSDVLITDTVTIIAVASALIWLLLIAVRGAAYGTATFAPLFMGLLWALGAMGLLGIPMTIATIAIGSMLLGLGVEYGSFIAERIVEETDEQGLEDGIMTAVPNTGKAVLGSSTTDLVGFLALLLASISFMRDLGLTLALGEGLTLAAALLLTPALIVKYERWKGDQQ
ncbi:MMPL family transporter [Candidatus Nanohalovita haloferacivicina]|uniref:MMPL family transporter n=1 Tax=Candidatus Nanohalovita haloferacivicina TaxID=2978046 RepID=UPI00325FA78B|nr:Putative exporter of the RND superfamily [Candidatus Nanohalobia archaeon BNXNv]